jgi:endogenous inhibitor of DNA gyrase (YacG/DUF329 family)
MSWHTVKRIDEECPCSRCGYPLYLGDRVFYARDEPFCSNHCAAIAADSRGATDAL